MMLTHDGIAYFQEPGIEVISRPDVDLHVLEEYFEDYDSDYLDDPDELDDGARLCKFAGQACYNVFADEKYTRNKDARKYFDNIKGSKHGSVLEHANYSVFIWGCSRAFTHELVRHRAGFSYSQLSQRYVDKVRFVEPEADQKDPELHEKFLENIVAWQKQYDERVADLMQRYPQLEGEGKRDYRKRINSDARTVLPNCTETQIIVTANARAWHHFFLMRADGPAWIEARRIAYIIWTKLMEIDKLLFEDFEDAGNYILKPKYIKV